MCNASALLLIQRVKRYTNAESAAHVKQAKKTPREGLLYALTLYLLLYMKLATRSSLTLPRSSLVAPVSE